MIVRFDGNKSCATWAEFGVCARTQGSSSESFGGTFTTKVFCIIPTMTMESKVQACSMP